MLRSTSEGAPEVLVDMKEIQMKELEGREEPFREGEPEAREAFSEQLDSAGGDASKKPVPSPGRRGCAGKR